jgi:hypothetical protein
MGRPRKIDPTLVRPADLGTALPNWPVSLSEAVDEFKARFPGEWDALRLCPLQHGLETMIERLKH